MAPGIMQGARAGVRALAAGAAPPVLLAAAVVAQLTGLILWAVTLLKARAATSELFADLGVTIESVQQLERAAGAAVAVLAPLLALLAAASAFLLPELGLGDAAGGRALD